MLPQHYGINSINYCGKNVISTQEKYYKIWVMNPENYGLSLFGVEGFYMALLTYFKGIHK